MSGSSSQDFDHFGDVGLIMFGVHNLCLGYLLYRSRYVPRIFGVLLVAAGFGYIADSLCNFFVPNYSPIATAVLLAPALVGELGLTLWLLVKGVKLPNLNRRCFKAPSQQVRLGTACTGTPSPSRRGWPSKEYKDPHLCPYQVFLV